MGAGCIGVSVGAGATFWGAEALLLVCPLLAIEDEGAAGGAGSGVVLVLLPAPLLATALPVDVLAEALAGGVAVLAAVVVLAVPEGGGVLAVPLAAGAVLDGAGDAFAVTLAEPKAVLEAVLADGAVLALAVPALPEGVPAANAALPRSTAARFSCVTVADSWLLS